MELFDYFEPVKEQILNATKKTNGVLGNRLSTDIKNCDVVLIGLTETRNNDNGKFNINTNNIRKYIYKLQDISKLNIADIGDLRLGETVSDTYSAINHIVEELLNKNIIPIIFGGTQEIIVPITEAIQNQTDKKVEVSFIDAHFDYTNEVDFHSNSYLHHQAFNNTLKTIIGYQSYFNSLDAEQYIKDNSFDTYRLGEIRDDMKNIEPVFRDTDVLSFDMSSIRQPDSPQNIFKSPNGLYAEEACRLSFFAGISDVIKCFAVNGIHSTEAEINQSEALMAQIIWHFIQGLSERQADYPKQSIETYKKIYIYSEKINYEFLFYKNEQNNRYWVQIPVTDENTKPEIISCSESDYKAICSDEIPYRIWKRISKLL